MNVQKVFLVTSAKWTSTNVPVHRAKMELNALMVPISTHASVQKVTQDNTVRSISTSVTLIPATMGRVKMAWPPLLAIVVLVIPDACVRQTLMNASASPVRMVGHVRTGRTRIFAHAPKELQVSTVKLTLMTVRASPAIMEDALTKSMATSVPASPATQEQCATSTLTTVRSTPATMEALALMASIASRASAQRATMMQPVYPRWMSAAATLASMAGARISSMDTNVLVTLDGVDQTVTSITTSASPTHV